MTRPKNCVSCGDPLTVSTGPGRRKTTCGHECAAALRRKQARTRMIEMRRRKSKGPRPRVFRYDMATQPAYGYGLMNIMKQRGYTEITPKKYAGQGKQLRPRQFVRTAGGRWLVFHD